MVRWHGGWVVVPKPSSSIRMCVDLKPLNESVMREVHPLPKVDITLAQLTGANCSQNWTQIVDFGRYHWQIHPDF